MARLLIGDSLRGIAERWPFLVGYPFAVTCNRGLADPAMRLEDGDEVALLPPVSGG